MGLSEGRSQISGIRKTSFHAEARSARRKVERGRPARNFASREAAKKESPRLAPFLKGVSAKPTGVCGGARRRRAGVC